MSKNISENIKVYCRLRPFLENEESDESEMLTSLLKVDVQDSSISYKIKKDSNASTNVKMNGIYTSGDNQDIVYQNVAKPIVDSALCGYSGTIIAYGPTNSGKTYTMLGNRGKPEEYGIMPRCIQQILSGKASTDVVSISYIQIYCEIITDLLLGMGNEIVDESREKNDVPSSAATQLYIREQKGGKIFVQGASRCTLNSMDDFYEIADMGNRNRATATTNMNDQSSRSHAVMIVNIASPTPIENDNTTLPLPPGTDGSLQNNSNTVLRESNLMLVDLAGSERASATSKLNSIRSDEGIAINLSLSALGNCISALASNNSGTSASHVPFRDSKLTRLLQNSLGGSSRTSIVVTLPPSCHQHGNGNILNALKFAGRASKIQVVAKVLRYVDYEKLYQDLLRQQDTKQEAEFLLKKEINEKSLYINSILEENQQLKLENKQLIKDKLDMQELIDVHNLFNKDKIHDTSVDAKEGSIYDSCDMEETLSALHLKYQNEIKQQNETFECLKNKYNLKEIQLNNAIDEMQEELDSERKNHLDTLYALTESKTRVKDMESSMQQRTQEHLNEITELRNKLEDVENQLKLCQPKVSDGMDDSFQDDNIEEAEETVPKSKVLEMESLFMDAINRLTDRVKSLEATKLVSTTNNTSVDYVTHATNRQLTIPSNNRNNNGMQQSRSSVGVGGSNNINSSANSRRLEQGGRIRPNYGGSKW